MSLNWAMQRREPAFDVSNFSSLFTVTGEKQLFTLHEGVNNFSSFFEVHYVNANLNDMFLHIKPTEKLLEFCRTEMVSIDYDQIYLKLIVFEDGSSTLYAQYNQIIGDRMLAKFGAKVTGKLKQYEVE